MAAQAESLSESSTLTPSQGGADALSGRLVLQRVRPPRRIRLNPCRQVKASLREICLHGTVAGVKSAVRAAVALLPQEEARTMLSALGEEVVLSIPGTLEDHKRLATVSKRDELGPQKSDWHGCIVSLHTIYRHAQDWMWSLGTALLLGEPSDSHSSAPSKQRLKVISSIGRSAPQAFDGLAPRFVTLVLDELLPADLSRYWGSETSVLGTREGAWGSPDKQGIARRCFTQTRSPGSVKIAGKQWCQCASLLGFMAGSQTMHMPSSRPSTQGPTPGCGKLPDRAVVGLTQPPGGHQGPHCQGKPLRIDARGFGQQTVFLPGGCKDIPPPGEGSVGPKPSLEALPQANAPASRPGTLPHHRASRKPSALSTPRMS